MFTVDVSCLVDRPLNEVFNYVADFRNAPSWQPQLDSVRLDGGPFPEGKQVVEIHHFLGVQVEAVGDLVDWQPLGGFTVRGPIKAAARGVEVRIHPHPGWHSVSLSLTMDPRGPARMMEPVLRRQLTHDLTVSFERLAKKLLETLTS